MADRRRLPVPVAVVRRLPGYYRHLREMEAMGKYRTSSRELSERMKLTASQIRQDLNCFGGFGQQGYGYHVNELKLRIGEILGLTRTYQAIIIGAGNIGRAVANYPSFRREGFEICALFDESPSLIGVDVQGMSVQPVNELEEWIAAHPVDIAILAVPADSSRSMFTRLVHSGVRAVWNFTPVDLDVPAGVVVQNVHLTDSLYTLTFRLRENEIAQRLD